MTIPSPILSRSQRHYTVKNMGAIMTLITSTLVMHVETVSKTLDHNAILAQLITEEDFIAFSHCEIFTSYFLGLKMYLRCTSQ
jgi:hypothetical protein